MERPFRYRKKLVKSGGSSYMLIPVSDTGVWKSFKLKEGLKEVILEVYKDRMVIRPYKKN